MSRELHRSVWIGRVTLLAGSVLLCWAFLELLALPLLIHEAPLDRQRYFTAEMQILAQDTKPGLVPRDYVLLLGDSNAKGFGDWLLSADYSGHPPFHSAHVIHEATGRDVLSFGQGGASNVDGLVRRPWQYALTLAARFGLGPPERLVVYFYAGNDLQGNWRYLRRAVERDGADSNRLDEPDYLDLLLRSKVERDRVWWKRWQAMLFAPRVVGRLAQGTAALARDWGFGDDPGESIWRPGETTQARIGGRLEWLPDRLQSPALVVPPKQFDRSLLVFDRALEALRALYPEQPILVVYLPSVLECYEITSPVVSIAARNKAARVQQTSFLTSRSADLRQRVAEVSRRRGDDFLDLTPALREAAAREPIHGPRDWHHFNEVGYRVLGREVAASGFIASADRDPREPTLATPERAGGDR